MRGRDLKKLFLVRRTGAGLLGGGFPGRSGAFLRTLWRSPRSSTTPTGHGLTLHLPELRVAVTWFTCEGSKPPKMAGRMLG